MAKSLHRQALADFNALRDLAGGDPEDSGEVFESIAIDMLKKPGTAEATKHLHYLIGLFFDRGGPEGASLMDDPQAKAIFLRQGLMDEDDDEGQ